MPIPAAVIVELIKLAAIGASTGYAAFQAFTENNEKKAYDEALKGLVAIDDGLATVDGAYSNPDLAAALGAIREAKAFLVAHPEEIKAGLKLAGLAMGKFSSFMERVDKQEFTERNSSAIKQFRGKISGGSGLLALIAIVLCLGLAACSHRYSRELVETHSDGDWASVELPLGVTMVQSGDAVTTATLNPGMLEQADGYVRIVYKVPATAVKETYINLP